jgi:hypothetical protein
MTMASMNAAKSVAASQSLGGRGITHEIEKNLVCQTGVLQSRALFDLH